MVFFDLLPCFLSMPELIEKYSNAQSRERESVSLYTVNYLMRVLDNGQYRKFELGFRIAF